MTAPVRFTELDPAAFRAALPELLEVYIRAMGYPPGTADARMPLWRDHSRRAEFRCVIAAAEPGHARPSVLAMTYGYRGLPGQWWHTEVSRGLGPAAPGWLDDYFELTELHVRPDHQGHGLGESLLRRLVAPVAARRVLLSTPEGENRAWRLYRRVGFTDVLRHFRFTGDARPFGVLGMPLPLDAPRPTAPTPGPAHRHR